MFYYSYNTIIIVIVQISSQIAYILRIALVTVISEVQIFLIPLPVAEVCFDGVALSTKLCLRSYLRV